MQNNNNNMINGLKPPDTLITDVNLSKTTL